MLFGTVWGPQEQMTPGCLSQGKGKTHLQAANPQNQEICTSCVNLANTFTLLAGQHVMAASSPSLYNGWSPTGFNQQRKTSNLEGLIMYSPLQLCLKQAEGTSMGWQPTGSVLAHTGKVQELKRMGRQATRETHQLLLHCRDVLATVQPSLFLCSELLHISAGEPG